MSQSPMQLRICLDEDRALVDNVIQAVLMCQGMELDDFGKQELRQLPDSFESDGGRFWVQEAQGSVIGTVGVRPVPSETGLWELKWLFLVPDWRGMGIGRMMVENALAFAWEQGAERIAVVLHGLLSPAYLLFRSLGFASEEEVPEEETLQEICLFLEKRAQPTDDEQAAS